MGGEQWVRDDRRALPFYIHTKHVNTVSNKQQVIPFYRRHGPVEKAVQSNTIKTEALVFVSDKKKLMCRYNYKNTRIEFSKYSRRSANYTTTVPPVLQPMYRMYFELIKMSHGEITTSSGVPRVNNVNYTSYLYGVCNPIGLITAMNTNKNKFINPQFFSSINLMDGQTAIKSSTQIFSSLTVNSQNFTRETVGQLGEHLSPMRQLIESDHKLNWICCIFALKTGGFVSTPNKLLLCWYNEMYNASFPERNRLRDASDWREYVMYMGQRMTECRSDMDLGIAQQLAQYDYKNVCVSHVLWKAAKAMADAPTAADSDVRMVTGYANYLSCAGYERSLLEYVVGLKSSLTWKWAGDVGRDDPHVVVFYRRDGVEAFSLRDGPYTTVAESSRRELEERVNGYIRSAGVPVGRKNVK